MPSEQELEARVGKYASLCRDIIGAMLGLPPAEGLSNDRIAARLDTRQQTASKLRQRFFCQRLAGLKQEPRALRPARLLPNLLVEVKRIACVQGAVTIAGTTAPSLAAPARGLNT